MCLNGNYSDVHINKYLPDAFSIHDGLKQGDALPILLFRFALVIRIWEGSRKPGGGWN
jgi:hypothetical protein